MQRKLCGSLDSQPTLTRTLVVAVLLTAAAIGGCGDDRNGSCVDGDGDGYGDGGGCLAVDCDDGDATRWQTLTAYADADSDGATAGDEVDLCAGDELPDGYVAESSTDVDCDDGDATRWQTLAGFADGDGDGLTAGAAMEVCSGDDLADGYLATASAFDDCDDTDAETGDCLDTIDSGGAHSCGIARSGALYCWGSNYDGALGDGSQDSRSQPVRVGDQTWRSLGLGTYHTCAIRTDDTLWCWGYNLKGELGNGQSGSDAEELLPVQVGTGADWAMVAAGGQPSGSGTTCAIKTNGTLWCWGYSDESGPLIPGSSDDVTPTPFQIGTDTDWQTVTVGAYMACALKTDGSRWCWGANGAGQLGTGSFEPEISPPIQGDEESWVAIAAASVHVCAVRVDGTLWCWGGNTNPPAIPYFLLGGGTTDQTSATAVQVGEDSDWVDVAAEGRFTCARKASGAIWCWGRNDSGQLGGGTFDVTTELVPVPGDHWRALSTGENFVCAIDEDNTTSCWGGNDSAQLGDGSTIESLTPSPVGTTEWAMASFSQSVCAIKLDGTLWCWGWNFAGQLGTDEVEASATPLQVGTDSDWSTVANGASYVCALRTDGTLWCWGYNGNGRLGDDSTDDRSTPTQIGTDSDWSEVASGGAHTCGLRGDGALYCWGFNYWGAVGDDSRTDRHVPTQVGTDEDWAHVVAGYDHTCALKDGGDLYCWGSSESGEVGTGTSGQNHFVQSPAHISGTWQTVGIGQAFTCGIKEDGSLWCWGLNREGELGIGTDDYLKATPTQVGIATNWVSLAVGGSHACAEQDDGSLWCWGYNYSGVFGNGTKGISNAPVAVDLGFTAQPLFTSAVTSSNACALTMDHQLYCWGDNEWGQLGDGTMLVDQASPIAVQPIE